MIPAVIHFIWYGCGKPQIPENYLIGLRSALLNTTCKIVLHTDVDFEMNGVEVRKISVPDSINGVPFKEERIKGYSGNGKRICHVSDITRLKILYDEGGIYSDMDVLWLRNPHEFFDKDVVIGWGNKRYSVLINCVMMSTPKQEAIKVYLDWATSIYPHKKYWIPANPFKIWKDMKNICYAERFKFFPVRWNKVSEIKWQDIESSVCVHLSQSFESPVCGEVIDFFNKRFVEKGWKKSECCN